MTAAAAATKKLRVGTGICLIIERDTITTAKSVASLTQGRQISALQTESELLYMRKHFGLGGLLGHLGLVVVADAVNAAKDLLKGKTASAATQLRNTRRDR